MSTQKSSFLKIGAGVAALALLSCGVALAQGPPPNVPYGAPLPAPGGGGPGGPGGGFRGFGGFAIGQIASVNGSTFTVTSMDGSTITIKTKPTTEFIKSTDSTVDAIKVGDTLQVGGRPDANNNITARRITDGTVGIGFPGGGPRPGGGAAGGGAGAPPAGAGAPGAGGPGGGGRRGFGGTTGVVTVLDPLTIKGTDGTTYTVDTTNVQTVSANTAVSVTAVAVGKYVIVIGEPPANAGAGGADGAPIAPPTSITANRVTISDTQPRFGGRGGGGFGRGGGGGAGGGAGAGAGAAVQ